MNSIYENKKTYRNTNIAALVKIKGRFYPMTEADMRGVGQIIIEDIEAGGSLTGVPTALAEGQYWIDALKGRYDESDPSDFTADQEEDLDEAVEMIVG